MYKMILRRREYRIIGSIVGFLVGLTIGVGFYLLFYMVVHGGEFPEHRPRGFFLVFVAAIVCARLGHQLVTKWFKIGDDDLTEWIVSGIDHKTGMPSTISVWALDYIDAKGKAVTAGVKPRKINEVKGSHRPKPNSAGIERTQDIRTESLSYPDNENDR